MRVGIIGRHAPVLRGAEATAAALGHQACGTLLDDDALARLRDRAVDALAIGGGVEAPSRVALISACTQAGAKPLEVFGPDSLKSALQSLS